jgi:AraC family transcriptional regulator
MTLPESYLQRFARVLDHVDENLDGELSVPALSEVAGLSQFHFQRLFRHYLGIGVHAYVQHVRLRRAAFQLAFRRRDILEIALDAGYGSHEAFTRAFRRLVGQPPSAFREAPSWARWDEVQAQLSAVRAQYPDVLSDRDIEVTSVPPTRVLAMEHRGDPRELLVTVRRFIAWRRAAGLSPAQATFNVAYVAPEDVAPAEFHFDIAVATDRRATEGVVEKVLCGGRCATFRHVGRDDDLWRKVGALDRWLATSGEVAGDAPLVVRRVAFFPDVPEHAAISDVFLPLAGTSRSPDTGDRGTRDDRSQADRSTAGSRGSASLLATD